MRIVRSTILFMIGLAVGCQPSGPDLSVSEIQIPAPDTPIRVDSQLNLNVDVSGTGPFTFHWSADRGTISDPTLPAISYTAPEAPGPVKVTVEVRGKEGQVIRTRNFQIVPGPEAPSGQVTLAHPREGDRVDCEVLAQGTYQPGLQEKIWPVVWVGGRYYPQDEGGKAPRMSNGKWRGTVRFGDCAKPRSEEKPEPPFTLIVVTANEQANRAFEEYLKASSLPGMAELPAGTEPQVEVGVTRK